MRICRFAVCLCAGLFGVGQQTGAIEPAEVLLFSWDPVTLKPQFGLTEIYNDNLFYQPKDKTSDLSTMISPGLGVLVGKRSENYLTLNYTFNQYLYVNRTDLNTSEHLIELNSNLRGERLSLRGMDRIQFLSSPIGSETQVLDPQAADQPFVVTEANIDRMTFYDSYVLSYKTTEKTSVYVQGLYSAIDYEPGVNLFDLTTYSATGGFGFQAFPKTVLFGEGYYGRTSSEANVPAAELPSLTFIGGALGARGALTPKLALLLRIGYETREVEDGTSLPGALVGNLALNYEYSSKTAFSLNYVRRQDVSIYFEQQSYITDAVSVQATQALGPKGKWKATIGGYYTLYDYLATAQSPSRNYDAYSAYFNLAYQVQLWFTASLGYERSGVLGGSTDVNAYDANRITLRLSIGY